MNSFSSALDIAARKQAATKASTRPKTAAAPAKAADIKRVDQGNTAEYDNAAQARTWSGSTCSAASLTAVLRSRGVNVRIADVMKAMPGAITPELGLVSRSGLVQAAQKFGLRARDDVRTFDDLRRASAAGDPVLVDVRNRKFPDGHWLVVRKVTASAVEVADSSGYRIKSIPRDQFLRDWSGKGVRVNGS
jgi:ABC-type bacteriocin/lantibiotic exporter with double-glycine peptidase domain